MSYLYSLFSCSWKEIFWLYLIAPAFFIIVFLYLKTRKNPLAFFLRFLVLALILTALAHPYTEVKKESSSLTVLLDSSKSINEDGQNEFKNLLEPLFKQSKELELEIFSFAKSLNKDSVSITSASELSSISGNSSKIKNSLKAEGTNIEASLKELGSLSKSSSIVLLSDGYETTGDSLKAAAELKAKGFSVYPLTGKEDSFLAEKLSISNLDVPQTSASGRKILIKSSLKNTFKTDKTSTATIWLGDEKLSETQIKVPSGEERVLTATSPPLKEGVKRVRVVLRHSGKVVDEIHSWTSVKKEQKVLLLSGSNDDEAVLNKLYPLQGISLKSVVANGKEKVPTDFSNFNSIILNNASKRQLPRGFLDKLETFVASGGGLLLIGGSRSFGLGSYIGTKLEKISPLKFVPPKTKKKRLINAVALVLDKSGSMKQEGRIDAAKSAALSSILSLKDEDLVTVIGFDQAPFVVIRLAPVSKVKGTASQRLRNLTPTNSTNLLPALQEARRALSNSGAGRKHIIVLSDGKFKGGSLILNEISTLRRNGISLSTVALGYEADVPMMESMASSGKGAFYQTINASKLPEIFIKDIKVAVGEETIQEQKDFPVAIGKNGLLSTSQNNFPILRGFVETKAKAKAKLELVTVKQNKKLPLLASWNFGKGRVVAFSSDANGRWSRNWLPWGGFANFWLDLLESTKEKAEEPKNQIKYDLRYKVEGERLKLDLSIFDNKLAFSSPPLITAKVKEPGGEESEINFIPQKKGRFISEIKDARPGDYKVDIKYGEQTLSGAALTIKEDAFGEKSGLGLNYSLLQELAKQGGGKLNPKSEEIFINKEFNSKTTSLVMPLFIIAFFLLLLEAFVRESSFSLFSRAKFKAKAGTQ